MMTWRCALCVVVVVAETTSQRFPDVPISAAIRAAVAAAHEVAGLPEKVRAHAFTIAAGLSHRPTDDAARLARSAIISARELADLPDDLAAKFRLVIGGVGFAAFDALAAIEWLERNDKAVVDVEIFYPDKNPLKIQVIGMGHGGAAP
jgi:hypothetical protein